ncbi:hypothetical protein FHT40_006779 [Mycolicibacterium sp. BK556]|uniref:hypothetical protein n=1 Tax=unclassified Mycolicibacterium TaxID=2636767 RepID=UPI001043B4DB|nr:MULTISPECIES: hypothetical protein [unclassified Mycolicibacterium]MBB3607079.1 hypothetical protein [Mycolicibacterium sp. BK556]MBB3636811.1 hypothetical protein [Mycolicibacterium sp. BK607]
MGNTTRWDRWARGHGNSSGRWSGQPKKAGVSKITGAEHIDVTEAGLRSIAGTHTLPFANTTVFTPVRIATMFSTNPRDYGVIIVVISDVSRTAGVRTAADIDIHAQRP